MNPAYQPSFANVPPAPPDMGAQVPIPAVNEDGLKEFLSGHSWPLGLQQTLVKNLTKIPIRFFICDNSGSMAANDGHRLVEGKRFVDCSRWSELTSTLQFHAQLARTAHALTEFRLLNNAPPLLIGDGTAQGEANYHRFVDLLQDSPTGQTPLCFHLNQVIAQIRAMAPQLRANSQRACVVVLTDGESSDGDIAQAMQPLKSLPAWVVVRMCTDEDKIVDYWNNIDSVLELDMDVLDDLRGEAEEIRAVNPWLTYGEPMHRLREFGIPIKEIDLLDEQTLSLDQIHLFVSLLLGGDRNDYPHPETDYGAFVDAVKSKLKKEKEIFNPLRKSLRPWVRVERFKKSSCAIS